MQSIQLKGHVQADGTLELCVPTGLPESDVEVIVVVQPTHREAEKTLPEERSWPQGYFERTAGCLADDPIRRWPQGEYEIRDDIQ
jgi:hypothetical protein